MANFTINGAQGKKSDTKPLVYINDDLLKTNLTNGDYTIENLGYGSNTTITLKGGGIVTFITYENTQSEISVPMSPDLYTLGYCTELAQGSSFTLKLMDTEIGVCAKVANCTADFPTGVNLNATNDMRLVFHGDPVEFLLI